MSFHRVPNGFHSANLPSEVQHVWREARPPAPVNSQRIPQLILCPDDWFGKRKRNSLMSSALTNSTQRPGLSALSAQSQRVDFPSKYRPAFDLLINFVARKAELCEAPILWLKTTFSGAPRSSAFRKSGSGNTPLRRLLQSTASLSSE